MRVMTSMASRRAMAWPLAGLLCGLVGAAGAGCAPSDASDDPVIIGGDVGPTGDLGAPDEGPPDATAPDAAPPARVLVERPPLPFAAEERVFNPTFDPRGLSAWVASPGGRGARIVDHRLPFAGPALTVSPVDDEAVAMFGRVRLALEPITASVWVGVPPVDGLPPEETHFGRVLAQLVAFTPDRDELHPIEYQLLRTDEIAIGPDGMVWQRYAGEVRRPTLGWGWLDVFGAGIDRLAMGAPSVRAVGVDPAALRRRAPKMQPRPVDPARWARLKALTPPPRPPARPPTVKGPLGGPRAP